MKKLLSLLVLILFLGCKTTNISTSQSSTNLTIHVTPTKQFNNLDWWYKIPSESIPEIIDVKHVHRNERFSLNIIFSGYEVMDDKVDLDYTIEVYDSNNNIVHNDEKNAFSGINSNPNKLILTENMPILKLNEIGEYSIRVTGIDNNNGKRHSYVCSLLVTESNIMKEFVDDDEKNKWIMNYYKNPLPEKLFQAAITDIQLSAEWFNKYQNVLYIFTQIYKQNKFLSDDLVKNIDLFDHDQQLKLLLLTILSGDDVLIDFAESKGWHTTIDFFKSLKLTTPQEAYENELLIYLDLYWADFFVSGSITPIKKIISTAKYMEYIGTLKKLKNNEIEKNDETIKMATFESMLQSAKWSLTSNLTNHPIIQEYLEFLYTNEDLTDFEKIFIEQII